MPPPSDASDFNAANIAFSLGGLPTLNVLYLALNARSEFRMAVFCAEFSFLGLFLRVAVGLSILLIPNNKFDFPTCFHSSKTNEYIWRKIHRKQGISR